VIKLKIDGKEIEASEGMTILEAATDAGIYIPNLCYHPDLPPVGACRLCIVKVEGMRGYPTSCTVKVREDMQVTTVDDELTSLRKDVLWLLTTALPKDVVKGSQFARVLEYVGISDPLPGFEPSARDVPVLSDDPLFVRDMQKCILCDRCVRMCQEVRGVGAIGLYGRGYDTIVASAPALESLGDSGCKFCRACVMVCPTGALQMREKQEEPSEEVVKECEGIVVPCKLGCPGHTDIPRYVRLVAEGRYQDAIEVIRQKLPFPESLGLVCHHPCEEECYRDEVSDPISIRELKRFVAERDSRRWKKIVTVDPDTGKKVAVVGGGPAGLTAAWFLKKKGHDVEVFEALPKAGGMLRAGIPDYRLPPAVVDREIKDITDIGVKLSCDTAVESLDSLFEDGFDAIFLALGGIEGTFMGIEGEDDPRVMDGISVLRDINFGKKVDLKGDIAVVGGGNVAIDVARTALRIGASSVTLLYRRSRKEMPAHEMEISDAIDEGVDPKYLTNPVKITPKKDSLSVECVKMQLGEPDSSGRCKVSAIDGSEFDLKFDRVVMAIGQKIVVPDGFDVELSRRGRVLADEKSLMTSRKGVFAGGDCVTGPWSVIDAIAAGRAAASSIDRYLGGDGKIDQKYIADEEDDPCIGRLEGFSSLSREHADCLPVKDRIPGFAQVECALSEEQAVKEASRCLKCQLAETIGSPPMPPQKKEKSKKKK